MELMSWELGLVLPVINVLFLQEIISINIIKEKFAYYIGVFLNKRKYFQFESTLPVIMFF